MLLEFDAMLMCCVDDLTDSERDAISYKAVCWVPCRVDALSA